MPRIESLRFTLLLIACAACAKSAEPTAIVAAPAKIGTLNAGAAYRQECHDNGVPVPRTVLDLDNNWNLHGDLAQTFVAPTLPADLWSISNFPRGEPDGLCLALPRRGLGNAPDILGMICMGRESGKVCFFAKPEDADPSDFPNIGAIDIEDMIGGADLIGNPEGICSDCHSGENPFVVHPEDPIFSAAKSAVGSFAAQAWPTPIIPDIPEWVPNPVPIDQLGPAPGPGCDSCHTAAAANRLPLISDKYPGYCNVVLKNAVGDGAAALTMPPSAYDPDDFTVHKAWLLAACNDPDGGGVIGPFSAPDSIPVLPPSIEPPYACSSFVTITGARLDALLRLTVDGVVVASAVTRSPAEHVFTLAQPLVEGQVVGVTQTSGGVTSTPVITWVRSHLSDYPDGLPAPEIVSEPVYECASSVGVKHVRGATVTVRKTRLNGTTYSKSKASGYSLTPMRLYPDGDFVVGDRFIARQTLCRDVSEWSAEEEAIDAPDSIPDLEMAPPLIGQALVSIDNILQGSNIRLRNVAPGAMQTYFDDASWPFRRVVDYDLGAPLVATDDLVATQQLCELRSDPPELPPPAPCNQENIIVEIATPHDGDDFVVVTSGLIPGATVRVFDPAGIEIGNGAGTVIGLTRDLVKGELIAVKQQMPGCVVDLAYFVIVQGT